MIYYSPILKWKRGERRAIIALYEEDKNKLKPAFEIPPPQPTSEKEKNENPNWLNDSLNNWLKDFGKDYKSMALKNGAYVDLCLLNPDDQLSNGYNTILPSGKTPLEFILNEVVMKQNLTITPMICLDQADLAKTISTYNILEDIGLCIKLKSSDLLKLDLAKQIKSLTSLAGEKTSNTDILIDLETPTKFDPIEGFASMLVMQINKHGLNKFKSLILSASSYPLEIRSIKKPFAVLLRREWELYKSLIKKSGTKITYSDYGSRPPGYNNANFYGIAIPNKLIYTIDNARVIYRGNKTHWGGGLSEYQTICKGLVDSDFFEDEDFSAADKYIYNCAHQIKEKDSKASLTGSPEKWIEVATNHHITKVIDDLSNIGGSL